jgi:hypothetical protein
VAGAGGSSRWIAGTERFPELLAALEHDGEERADFPRAIERAPAAGSGRRTAILIGDFYEAEPLSRALAALGRAQRVCVQVVAKEELHAPDAPAARLRDAESGEELEVQLDDATRARFAEAAERFLDERRQLAARHGARYTRLQPGADLVAAVEEVLVA